MATPQRRDRPHDLVFRYVFSRVVHARGALRSLVGEDVAERLDWPSLQRLPGTYVEAALRDSMSDLLFSIRFADSQRRALAYVLWDHQRNPHRLMPLRMLLYATRSLHDYTERPDAIAGYVPTLIPIVLFQGPKKWSGPSQLSELSTLPGEPRPPVFMDLRMIVHELRDDSLPPERLTTLARTTVRLLRLAALGRLVSDQARPIASWLMQVHHTHGYADYRALLEYILRAGKDDRMIHSLIEHYPQDMQDSAMSIADKLEARGRVKGERDGKILTIIEQLDRRFGGIPVRVESRVIDGSDAELKRWALRLLDATTLDEVFAEP